MKPHRRPAILARLKALFAPSAPAAPASPERQRAAELLKAIDAGGLPLNPARVNDIARRLGLEVATTAPVEVTIERIRACMKR